MEHTHENQTWTITYRPDPEDPAHYHLVISVCSCGAYSIEERVYGPMPGGGP